MSLANRYGTAIRHRDHRLDNSFDCLSLRKPLLSLALLLCSDLRKILLCHVVGSVDLVHGVLRRLLKLLPDLRPDRHEVVASECQETFSLEFLLPTVPVFFPRCWYALLGVPINLGFGVGISDLERVQGIIKTRRVQGSQFPALARLLGVKPAQSTVNAPRLLLSRLGILGRRSPRRVLLLLGEQRISLCLLARGLGLLGSVLLPDNAKKRGTVSIPNCNVGKPVCRDVMVAWA